MTKHKYLTLSDRNDIQLGLERGETFKAIGKFILKDPTTVSKKVKRNKQIRDSTSNNLLALYSIKLLLSVMGALKEDKIVAIRKSSTSLNKIKNNTNKLLSKLVYENFQNCLALKQLNSRLEMDTVLGRMGGKVLLTFNLSFCNFIFARLLDNKTSLEVTKHLYDIKNTLHQADKDFFQLFPVILTDNGGEFARVDGIEMDIRGESKLFFCDPNRSDQKGRIEKNHTLIRDILPKGTSFDNLTQEDINLVCSHVNSVKRAALNGKSAYELFAFTYGEEIPKLLGISKIPAEDVCQSSTLLQHKI